MCPGKDKDPVTSTPASAELVTLSETLPHSSAITVSGQQYEELDGDILEYPSTITRSVSSEDKFIPQPFSNRAPAASEEKEKTKSYFSLHRLSTSPLSSPLYEPIDPSHASPPAFPKLGLLSKTCKALQRRCTVTGSSISYNEHSRLTSPSAVCPSMHEDSIPLAPLSYGSSISYQQPVSPNPCLHFTMALSPDEKTLAVTVLSLTGTSCRLEDVTVLGSLPPVYPCPLQASAQSSLGPLAYTLVLFLKVSSVEELQKCVLRIAVYIQKPPSSRGPTLGELEVECGGRNWKTECPICLTMDLIRNKRKLKKVLK